MASKLQVTKELMWKHYEDFDYKLRATTEAYKVIRRAMEEPTDPDVSYVDKLYEYAKYLRNESSALTEYIKSTEIYIAEKEREDSNLGVTEQYIIEMVDIDHEEVTKAYIGPFSSWDDAKSYISEKAYALAFPIKLEKPEEL